MKFLCSLFFLTIFFTSSFSNDTLSYKKFKENKTCFFKVLKGCNIARYMNLKDFLNINKADTNVLIETQAINLLGENRNIIVTLKGLTDTTVYITSHYDKIDANIFTTFNINGIFDFVLSPFFLSDGAYDNGSGCFISTQLLDTLKKIKPKYTYKFLYTGMEEYGLFGSRVHVSSLSQKEWSKVLYDINIDMVGANQDSSINVSDISCNYLMSEAINFASNNKIKISIDTVLVIALSDYEPFRKGQSFFKDLKIGFMASFIGFILPQRSYFTKEKEPKPIVNFTDKVSINWIDMLSGLSPVAFSITGAFHCYRDKEEVLKDELLYNYYLVILNLIQKTEKTSNIKWD